MPFNGSGVFVRLENWSNDAASNLPISATKFDIEDNDFAGGFDLALTRDGQGAPTSPLVWAQQLTLNRGSDGVVQQWGRTGGSNNPALQMSVADATGFTLGTTIATAVAIAIAGTAALTIGSARNVTIGVPTAGTTLALTGVNGSAAETIASSGAASSFGVGWNWALYGNTWNVLTQSTDPLGIGTLGAAAISFATNSSTRLSISATGAININQPTSGTPLTVNQANGTDSLFTSGSTTVAIFTGGAASGIFDTAAATGAGFRFVSGSPRIQVNNADALTVDTSGHFTIAAPSSASGNGLLVNGPTNNWTVELQGSATSGQSFGLLVFGGTTSADGCVSFRNSGNTSTFFGIDGAGHVSIAAPSSGTALAVAGAAAGSAAIAISQGTLAVTCSSAATGIQLIGTSAGTTSIAYGTGFYSTGTAAPVLTANKPGAGTAIIGWLNVVLNGTQGWVPVWGN